MNQTSSCYPLSPPCLPVSQGAGHLHVRWQVCLRNPPPGWVISDEALMATVLIVEDNSDARKLMKAILKREHLEVVVAEDGVEGLERARAESPDLIITDI